jgi:hypothetical protein
MPAIKQECISILMDKNSLKVITDEEYQELSDLVERGQPLLDRGYKSVLRI